MADPESSSRGLNPGMVYRPISPPSNQLDAQDEHQKPIKMRFNFIAVLRFFIVVFSFAATLHVLTDGRWRSGTIIMVIILEYICMVWSLIQILALWVPRGKGGFYWRLRIGKLNLACGNEDEDPAEQTSLLSDDDGGKKEFFKLGPNVVDLALALLLVIFIPIDSPYFYSRAAFTGLSFTIFGFEVVVGILSIFHIFNGTRIEIFPDRSSAERFQYRIRLPVPETKKNPGQQISVTSEDV